MPLYLNCVHHTILSFFEALIEYYLSMIKCSRKEIIAPAVCLCCFFAAFCAFEGLKAEYSRAKYIIL